MPTPHENGVFGKLKLCPTHQPPKQKPAHPKVEMSWSWSQGRRVDVFESIKHAWDGKHEPDLLRQRTTHTGSKWGTL